MKTKEMDGQTLAPQLKVAKAPDRHHVLHPLDNEDYILRLLSCGGLIGSDQARLICDKKSQQRQLLLKQHSARRKSDTGRERDESLNFVDIIVSLNLELPGKKGQLGRARGAFCREQDRFHPLW